MGIDLNTIDEGEEEEGEEEEEEIDEVPLAAASSVCLELWHACAGPRVWLPRKGSLVVYFPQGHLAKLGAVGEAEGIDLPPHILCRVVDVNLKVGAGALLFFLGFHFASLGESGRKWL